MGGGGVTPVPTGNIPESALPDQEIKVNVGRQECPPHWTNPSSTPRFISQTSLLLMPAMAPTRPYKVLRLH